MKNDVKFIVYTPPYNVDFGGVLVLYKLAELLRSLGYSCYIWPNFKPGKGDFYRWRYFMRLLSAVKKFFLRTLDCKSPYNIPLASYRDISDAIVIYPELVDGNPLDAKMVVRWLLHRPGAHTGKINFGKDDLFFYFDKQFDDPAVNRFSENHLNVIELMGDKYKHVNFGARSGVCYMVRKGFERPLDKHPDNAILLDDCSHDEIAKAFNACEMFISYDLYTMYSRYAAMCGCISVVVPEEGVTKDQWYPDENCRYGIAYGFDDIPWARATRDKLLSANRDAESRYLKSVSDFTVKCKDYFFTTNALDVL